MKTKIDEWEFEDKYDLLGTPEKTLHQTRLIRADIDDAVYIAIAFIFFWFAFRLIYHPNLRYISLALGFLVLLYGLYKHFKLRSTLKKKFEHQSRIEETQ